jgi:hypothetical protein
MIKPKLNPAIKTKLIIRFFRFIDKITSIRRVC